MIAPGRLNPFWIIRAPISIQRRLPWAALELFPTLELGEAHDSNIYAKSEDERGDAIGTIRHDLELVLKLGSSCDFGYGLWRHQLFQPACRRKLQQRRFLILMAVMTFLPKHGWLPVLAISVWRNPHFAG